MARFSIVLLVVLALVVAVPAAPRPDDALVAARALATPFVHNANHSCRATCESKIVDSDPHNTECWGLYKLWCGPRPAPAGQEPHHELSGVACQGHWKTMTTTIGEMPAVVAVCEGGHRWLASQTSTCPHSGHTTKRLMGVLSVGDIITVMGRSGQATSTTPATQPEAQRWQEKVAQALRSFSVPRSVGVQAGGEQFSLESKHEGFKVEWQANKHVAPGAAGSVQEDTWETLDQEAQDLFGPSWRDWLPGGPPPPPKEAGEGSFELLCNGKPAWAHGALPCWGNFTVAGERTSSPHAGPAASSSKPCGKRQGHTKRHLLAAHLTSRQDLHHASEAEHMSALPASTKSVGLAAQRTVSMKAECDGMWTGILGHTCMGVSTSRLSVVVEEEGKPTKTVAVKGSDEDDDAEEEDGPALTKFSVCSGRQAIKFIHRDNTFGMAVSCKGHSLLSMNVTMSASA